MLEVVGIDTLDELLLHLLSPPIRNNAMHDIPKSFPTRKPRSGWLVTDISTKICLHGLAIFFALE